MNVRIRGFNEVLTRTEIKTALNFFASKLMSGRLADALHIDLLHDPKMKLDGMVCWSDRHYRPRCFEMLLNPNLGKRKQLLALAHEMVHVKQYAKGELAYSTRVGLEKWQGEFITEDQFSYYEKPWEIEAYGREVGLYHMYMSWKRSLKS